MTSDKQLSANKENAKKGGIKTQKGKEISKFNAFKHGILSEIITEYDKPIYNELFLRLMQDYQPLLAIEEILVERIALLYIRLCRAVKAEKEYHLTIFNPKLTETKIIQEDPLAYDFGPITKTTIINEGYKAKIEPHHIEKLEGVYHRYEKNLENRLFRTLHELERVQRSRQGEKLPAPLPIDINMNNEKE